MGRESLKKRKETQPDVIMEKHQPSVEIKRDSKGNVSLGVKVYEDKVEDAMSKAVKTFKALITEFKTS